MHRVLAAAVTAVLALSLVPLASAQDVTLSGQVLDQDGQPVEGAQVSLYQDPHGYVYDTAEPTESCTPEGECTRYGPGHAASAITDAEGRFTLDAYAGWAQINVWKEGYAGSYQSIDVDGEPLQIELLKFPEKTAHIQGTVRGGSGSLPYVSIAVENPLYGVYECSVRQGDEKPIPVEPDGGIGDGQGGAGSEPGSVGGSEAGSDGGSGTDASEGTGSGSAGDGNASQSDAMTIAPGEPYPGWSGCAITVRDDGSFEGNVTPGYSILRFSHDSWRGGAEYYSVSRVMDLAAGQTTRIDVQLTARPGPDAVLGGHVIDKATQKAVPGAQISFSSQDAYGWANAQTDKDGSYQVKLRSGYVQIHVWAEGYLPWEGQVTVRAASEGQRLTIELTEGQALWGGCCIAYEDGVRTLEAGGKGAAVADGDAAASGHAFEDLGGGLGPYDPATAEQGVSDGAKGAPGAGIVVIALGVLALAFVVRRR